MRFKKQKYSTSCGIACVAMLTGKSHNAVMQKAIKLFDWDFSQEFLEENSLTNSRDLIRLLAKFGLTAKLKKFESWDALEGRNIIAVWFDKKKNYWHWIVAERKDSKLVILDPKAERPLVLFKNEKPDGRAYGRRKIFYLKVQRPYLSR